MPTTVKLRKPLERAIRAGHPWVYRDALMPAEIPIGEPVTVLDKRGRPLAIGLGEAGPIAVRIFSTRPKQRLRPELFRQRIDLALDLRERVIPNDTTCFRWIHGEGDGLPGVVLDRYGDFAVLKLDGEAIGAYLPLLAELLEERLTQRGIRGLLLRASRKQRGATSATAQSNSETQLLFGSNPLPEVEVRERGMRLVANLYSGQKTGLFLDHRESRQRVRELAFGLRVLNLYGYTGAFSVAAALGGALEVTTVDVAAPALELAERSFAANQLPPTQHRICALDVPKFLHAARAAEETYDLVIADPPNFAPNAKSLENALESYAKLHAASLELLREPAWYLAASCSSHVRMTHFHESLHEGARRARRTLTILEQHGAPADHPRRLAFPEGDYLKVVLCGVA